MAEARLAAALLHPRGGGVRRRRRPAVAAQGRRAARRSPVLFRSAEGEQPSRLPDGPHVDVDRRGRGERRLRLGAGPPVARLVRREAGAGAEGVVHRRRRGAAIGFAQRWRGDARRAAEQRAGRVLRLPEAPRRERGSERGRSWHRSMVWQVPRLELARTRGKSRGPALFRTPAASALSAHLPQRLVELGAPPDKGGASATQVFGYPSMTQVFGGVPK
eukprot:gene10572-biopygen834